MLHVFKSTRRCAKASLAILRAASSSLSDDCIQKRICAKRNPQLPLPQTRSFFTRLFRGPRAQREKAERTACGQTWTDSYKWLEEGGEPLRTYLQDETEYTKQVLKGKLRHLKEFRKQIREASAPVIEFPEVWWPYEYWTEPSEVDPDDQTFYRKNLRKPDAKPQLLVDTGTLEDDYGQTGVGGIKLSPCQSLLALLTEFEKGSESYTIHILDLEKEQVLEDEIIHPNVSGCEWSKDSKKLIYTTHDNQNRPQKVWVHVLGTPIKEDVCILEEKDPKFYLHVGSTKSREFLVITAASKMSSEVHLLPGSAEMPYTLTLVQERQPGLEYFVECWTDMLVILANDTLSGNYALSATQFATPQKKNWEILIDENDEFVIEDLEMNYKKWTLVAGDFHDTTSHV